MTAPSSTRTPEMTAVVPASTARTRLVTAPSFCICRMARVWPAPLIVMVWPLSLRTSDPFEFTTW